jgi:hypothetical protein
VARQRTPRPTVKRHDRAATDRSGSAHPRHGLGQVRALLSDRRQSQCVDKQDLKRFSEFVNHKVYDLLVCGVAVAKANGRNIIAPFDLPVT